MFACYRPLVAFALTTALVGTAYAGPKQVQQSLSARSVASAQVQEALNQALFASYNQQVDLILDGQWTPAFAQNLMGNKAIRRLKGIKAAKTGKATAGDLTVLMAEQIKQRREALHAPLKAAEAAFVTRFAAHTEAMQAMSAAVASGASDSTLPKNISQTSLPSQTQLRQALADLTAAITTLNSAAAASPSVINAWPELVTAYTDKVNAVTKRLGG